MRPFENYFNVWNKFLNKGRFFRSAMFAMANRFRADLLIENISFIFEEENKDRLHGIATYFFAIIERFPLKWMR